MKRGKVLIIGPVGSGKSTLVKRLLGEKNSSAKKTQALGLLTLRGNIARIQCIIEH